MQAGYGVCPVCNGSCRMTPPPHMQSYKVVFADYDAETDTLGCHNCGGQRQWGKPTGEVKLNKNGDPCHHRYKSTNIGRCLTRYTCEDCGDRYDIDSGD